VRFLSDHNVEGQTALLWGTLAVEGWLSLLPLELVTFIDVGLPVDADDRTVWRFAQENSLVLITGNRRMRGMDTLEETIRAENTASALPVLTVGNIARMDERLYREQCAVRLVEIALSIEDFRGTGRLYIP
jgi:hypothetical protein